MRTVVDTSALLALLYPDDGHNERAVAGLTEAAEAGELLVNETIYAELAADSTFETREDLEYFLSDTGITVETPPQTATFRAGESYGSYLDRRGETLQCPACGHETTVECPDCGTTLSARQHLPADFLIGAHAETADRLLTFDSGFYREYFDVEIVVV
jgi:hypothetical protein